MDGRGVVWEVEGGAKLLMLLMGDGEEVWEGV
jgi:hypothetical protein